MKRVAQLYTAGEHTAGQEPTLSFLSAQSDPVLIAFTCATLSLNSRPGRFMWISPFLRRRR